MLARSDICSHCGQALPPPPSLFDAVKLSAMQRRLVERVAAAGQYGIPGIMLFDMLYGHDVNGGPLSGMNGVRSRIALANVELRRIGKVIRAPKGGRGDGPGNRRYVLRDLP